MKSKDINRLVDDTMNSLDGINEANFDPDDIIFRKIMSGVSQKESGFINEDHSFSKYAIAFALIILINVFSIINFYTKSDIKSEGDTQNYSESLNEFSNRYFSVQDGYNYNRNELLR